MYAEEVTQANYKRKFDVRLVFDTKKSKGV